MVASGTGIQNLGSSKDRERPGGDLRYRTTELRQQQAQGEGWTLRQVKGTVSQDFLLPVFFMNQFPPSPRVSH